jgi:hypothetical protein
MLMQWTPYLKQIEFFFNDVANYYYYYFGKINVYNAQFMLKVELLWTYLGYGH